jgi:hypothetical protein
MSSIKWLVGAAAVGVIVAAFWDFENARWLAPAGLEDRLGGPGAAGEADELEPEPVLGYDGMDQDTLIDWLGNMQLDRDLLLRVRRYEATHRNRETVLTALTDMLG